MGRVTRRKEAQTLAQTFSLSERPFGNGRRREINGRVSCGIVSTIKGTTGEVRERVIGVEPIREGSKLGEGGKKNSGPRYSIRPEKS